MSRLLRGVRRLGKTAHVFQIDARIETLILDGNLATSQHASTFAGHIEAGGNAEKFKIGLKKKGGGAKYTHAAAAEENSTLYSWEETISYTATLYRKNGETFQPKEYIFEVQCAPPSQLMY